MEALHWPTQLLRAAPICTLLSWQTRCRFVCGSLQGIHTHTSLASRQRLVALQVTAMVTMERVLVVSLLRLLKHFILCMKNKKRKKKRVALLYFYSPHNSSFVWLAGRQVYSVDTFHLVRCIAASWYFVSQVPYFCNKEELQLKGKHLRCGVSECVTMQFVRSIAKPRVLLPFPQHSLPPVWNHSPDSL